MATEKITVSIKEAMAATGLGRDTIMSAVKRGDLPHVKVGLKGLGQGRRVLIPADALRTWATPAEGK